MPLRLLTTAAAEREMLALVEKDPMAYVELHTTLGSVSQAGLPSKHHIAVVNHQYDIHILEPVDPAPDALVISDSKEMLVVELRNPKGEALSRAQKRHLAAKAAAAKGVTVSDIYVP